MKLRTCYVFSFGKLKNMTFDFSDGLNTFKQDNGWGKTTLATFIKCIFYGLNDSKRSIAENERIKYKTWNSTEKFGGYVEFEWGGKEFRLERFFGNKASEDTVRLLDLNTGKTFQNTENLGNRIFQIDEEGFLSTTYFSQKDFQVKSNTSLTAKFNSVCEIQDTELFDRALTRLEEKAKTYKYRGDKGLISDTKREMFAVNEQIEIAKKSAEIAQNLKENVVKLENQVEQLKQQTADLTKKVTEAGRMEAVAVKKARYEIVLSKRNELLAKKREFDFILNGKSVQEQEINAYAQCCAELNKVVERENMLLTDIRTLEAMPKTQQNPVKKFGKAPEIFALIGSVLFIVALVLCFIDSNSFAIIYSVLFALTALLEIGSIVLKLLDRQKNIQDDTTAKLLEQKNNDYNEFKNIRLEYEQKIDAFIKRFNLDKQDRTSSLSTILNALKSAVNIDKELLELNIELLELEKDKPLFEIGASVENIVELKRRLDAVQDEYSKSASELASKRSDMKFYQDKADSLSELEDKKAELSERLEQYKQEYEILLKTLEFLTKADENLKIKYRAPLQDSLNKYLSLITGNSRTASIDIDLNVTVQEMGLSKEPEYYSKGEQNLFEICKRFALTDVLFTGEKPFIILDDPFYNLDDDKLELSLELIKKLANEYQIIYFVCHESRRA